MENILQATRLILQQNDCMTDDLKGKTDQLNDYVTFLIQVTEKELRGEKLTEPEYRTLEYMGSSIEYFTLSVVDPDLHLDDWSLVQGPDKSIAIRQIRINGVSKLHSSEYSIIPDQIEAGTFMVAAAATHGDVLIKNVIPKHLEAISVKLIEIGATVEEYDDAVRVSVQ